jgi:RNA ligase
MRKFSSINQFRHVVETVEHKATYIGQSPEDLPMYDKTRPLPKLTFTGTVKLHGTNGGVAFDVATEKMTAQARERELTIDDDNHGFCKWVESDSGSHSLMRIFQVAQALHRHPIGTATLHAFGEWCGPSVNGKTAIGQLPERFVVFAILVTHKDGSEHWMDVEDVAKAFNMYSVQPPDLNFSSDFERWTMEIDFSKPEEALDTLEALTLEVEACCPAAKARKAWARASSGSASTPCTADSSSRPRETSTRAPRTAVWWTSHRRCSRAVRRSCRRF